MSDYRELSIGEAERLAVSYSNSVMNENGQSFNEVADFGEDWWDENFNQTYAICEIWAQEVTDDSGFKIDEEWAVTNQTYSGKNMYCEGFDIKTIIKDLQSKKFLDSSPSWKTFDISGNNNDFVVVKRKSDKKPLLVLESANRYEEYQIISGGFSGLVNV